MRIGVGAALIVIGVSALFAAQRTRRHDWRPLNQRLTPNDPVWGLPMSGRVVAAIAVLVIALGAVLMTTR